MASKISLAAFATLSSLLAFAACSGDDPEDAGADSGSEPAGCDTDYSRLDGHATVSFASDVMPIFGQSCTGMSCHDEDGPKADLLLGPRCSYNSETGGCDFDPALTAEQLAAVYDNLVGVTSKTASSVNRIVAGDPANSFLLMKTANVHNDQGLSCTKLGLPSDPECGQGMPFPGESLCNQSAKGATKHETIAAWVLQGAQNN